MKPRARFDETVICEPSIVNVYVPHLLEFQDKHSHVILNPTAETNRLEHGFEASNPRFQSGVDLHG
jgi:hypothetical protein